jgi:hypothetical protein
MSIAAISGGGRAFWGKKPSRTGARSMIEAVRLAGELSPRVF